MGDEFNAYLIATCRVRVDRFYFLLSRYQDYVKPFRDGGKEAAWDLSVEIDGFRNFIYNNFYVCTRVLNRFDMAKILWEFEYWKPHCQKYLRVLFRRRTRISNLVGDINLPEDIANNIRSYL